MIKKKLLAVFVGALVAGQTGSSEAAYIPGVAVQAVSSYTNGVSDHRLATNLVTDVGLFGDILTTAPQGSMWVSFTNSVTALKNESLTFDLGVVHPIKEIRVWPYNEGANQNTPKMGLRLGDILTSTDGVTYVTNFPNFEFNIATGTFTNTTQSIDLGGLPIRFVKINVLTNWGSTSRVGLGKVRFVDTNIPPTMNAALRNYSSNKVMVVFSETVVPSTATNSANYSIQTDGTNSATVLGATMDLFNNRVILDTTLLSNSNYTLVASGVAAASDGTTITNGSSVSIQPALSLWLRADAGVSADGNNLVERWDDQSGNENSAVQNDPLFKPTLANGSLNGKPVLHFSGVGSTNFMDIPSPALTAQGDLSVFVVARFDTFGPPTFHTLLSKINPTNTQPWPFESYVAGSPTTAGRPTFLRGSGYGNSGTAGISNMVTSTGYVISYSVRGTNAIQYLNGAFNGAVAATHGVGDSANVPVRIGSRVGNGTSLNGDLAEVMVVHSAVTDVERIAINEYLGSKYGIPIISLVFNQQPQSVTKLEGQTAKFSVNVTANSPNIAYQWQRNGTNIPNATNATYTTPILAIADNNSTYRVLVTVVNSSQLSDAATLSVVQDFEKPTVVYSGRMIWDASRIVVVFSERVDAATGLASANYVLDNGALVVGTAAGETANKIILLTSGLTTNGTYTLSVQNVKDLFGNTIDLSQSAVGIYPAAALWLKADTGVIADGSGRVSEWDDQSGNANHAMPFGGPETFPILTNGFNNQPVLHFGSEGSTLTTNYLACSPSPSLALTGDMSVYAVARFTDFAAYRTILSKTTLNQPAPYDFYLTSGSGLPRLVRGDGTASTIITASNAVSAGTPHLVYATAQENTVTHFLDGNFNGTGIVTAPIGDTGNFLYIGHRYPDAGTTMKGDIAEILLISSSLSDADRTSLDNYFAAKYNLTLGMVPNLSIVPGAGNSFTLAWPVPTATFTLESSTNLSGGTWTVVTNAIGTTGGTNSVTINVDSTQQFYRLHKQ